MFCLARHRVFVLFFYKNIEPECFQMGCTSSGSLQTPLLPTLCLTLHIFVLPEWPQKHFEFATPAISFSFFLFFSSDGQMLFHLISKWSSGELAQFSWEIWMALEFSLILEGFNSSREVPPSISLFHLTRILKDASLKTGDPCLEEPLWSHLHIPRLIFCERFCYWSSSFSFLSHVTGLIPLTWSTHSEWITLFYSTFFLHSSISPISLFNNEFAREMPGDSNCHQTYLTIFDNLGFCFELDGLTTSFLFFIH